MKYTIYHMKNQTPDGEIGYAFLDEFDSCIIIVYGERRKKDIIEYMNKEEDPYHIKYKCFYLERK